MPKKTSKAGIIRRGIEEATVRGTREGTGKVHAPSQRRESGLDKWGGVYGV